ncbi:MAG: hypothetical protein ABI382_10705 [Nakamurella sp.]
MADSLVVERGAVAPGNTARRHRVTTDCNYGVAATIARAARNSVQPGQGDVGPLFGRGALGFAPTEG